MKQPILTSSLIAVLLGSAIRVTPAATPSPGQLRSLVTGRVETEYPSLLGIYTNLHAHPELSFMEVHTAALVAGEWRALGFTVTEKVGRTGVVGVFTNGPGPTVLVRGDMDALPVKENSGVAYPSRDIVKDMKQIPCRPFSPLRRAEVRFILLA